MVHEAESLEGRTPSVRDVFKDLQPSCQVRRALVLATRPLGRRMNMPFLKNEASHLTARKLYHRYRIFP